MHLQNHAGIKVAQFQPVMHINHGPLDDVGCSALHGRVDGGALGGLAHHCIARIDARQIKPPPE